MLSNNYFTEKDGYELADNITYLGNHGVITMTPDNEPTAEPLSVCYSAFKKNSPTASICLFLRFLE